MTEDTVATRLKRFMEDQGISSTRFADLCGIPRPTLSQLITGRNKKISDVLLSQIHTAFPSLSVMWLIFGEGSMLTDNTPDHTSEEAPSDSDNQNLPNNPQASQEFSKEMPLNSPEKAPSTPDIQSLQLDLKNQMLMKQIENMKANPRKVIQITVYYDDASYETCLPK